MPSLRRLLRSPRLRMFASRTAAVVVVAQLLCMVAMTAFESLRKKQRKTVRFPTSEPEPVAVDRTEMQVYTFGEDLYEDMITAIEGARERIYFETYIWKADAWGQRVKEALIAAAERGVDVYVIWDEFANLVVRPTFFRFPRSVHTLRFPLVRGIVGPRHWGLDHRKMLVVDGEVGFLGGYNIGSLYATGWRDTHARVAGPDAAELANAFIDFWNGHRHRHHPVIDDNPPRSWFSKLRVHRNTPRIAVYPIRNMYLEAIDRATERIWMTHAYLIPDDDLVAALRQAARRGVDVRIIVPERSNHVVADWLSRGYYTRLLRGGIRLFLYEDAMVHSKTATMDDAWVTIGTANLDRLSLMGNYEVNLEVLDRGLARHMREIFEMDLTNCYELTLDAWERRSWVAKLTEAFLSPWRPFF
ncbi:phosphatidylserine/phosphatidylglycerophosphate/cardiolipin synthase family protein [uncultured Tessaracoccus sp.]|uniref:phospholipase D-like domain-containing protein n=1 Tax=uncultured Tessaracoccus sp. TaxID=905023 RepID=UPI0025E39813|nr:phospholipase D-like domain-containing protein [uncultured Tessaracoccus sp.]